MILSLDHQQRLNLIVLLGMQECNVGETRAVWRLQDLLNLDDAEKLELGLSFQTVNGNELYQWDRTKTIPIRDYELPETDIARLQRALLACPRIVPGQARAWLEPLLSQMPNAFESNGAAPTKKE